MKFATFDLELSNILPDGKELRDVNEKLGISCAAIFLSDQTTPIIFQGIPSLSVDESKKLVQTILDLNNKGYKIASWNGCSFDFHVLAMESGMYEECARLALNHIDAMLYITFQNGYYLSLQAACKGAGLQGKLKSVILKDGTKLNEMSGIMAPGLWQKGETEAVIEYLKEDVIQLMNLIKDIEETKTIKWTNKKGRLQTVHVGSLITVSECFSFPEPDTSWMTNPPQRKDFISWMPGELTWPLIKPV